MLNTKKLLYILPDLAYIAELLPSKKPHEFNIQSFRQINGEFLKKTKFIEENLKKLFSKLDEDEYTLILPDLLFINTIVNIEGDKKKVDDYIDKNILSDLKITRDSHHVETFILTEHKGVSKVQLSALENNTLAPIKQMADKFKVSLDKTYPLSWTLKSLISLEPSISIVQMGSNVYLAQHYIGIDQASSAEVSEAATLAETVKTLKGAEPSIQTLYLVTSPLAEDKVKKDLESVLPVQQLAGEASKDEKMPSYIKRLIEASMKTISIPDYKVTSFDMKKVKIDKKQADGAKLEETKITKTSADKAEKKDKEEKTEGIDLPKPEPKIETPANTTDEKKETETKKVEEIEELPSVDAGKENKAEDEEKSSLTIEAPPAEEKTETKSELAIEPPQKEKTETKSETTASISLDLSPSDEAKEKDEDEQKDDKIEEKSSISKDKVVQSDNLKSLEEVDLKQFTQDKQSSAPEAKPGDKKVIKNKSGTGSMLKMFFIGLASFSATVAIGVGIGLGVLSLSNKGEEVESPVEQVAEVSETPTEPTATPTPEPVEIDKEKYNILVVNATTQAGYAGKTKTALEENEYTNIDAKNAQGDYEEGFFVLLDEEDSQVVDALSKDSGLDLTYAEGKKTEDSSEEYDAVIVLAK